MHTSDVNKLATFNSIFLLHSQIGVYSVQALKIKLSVICNFYTQI